MDITQSPKQHIDPEIFAEWIQEVALINEQFSEALHEAADTIAVIDTPTAMGLYRAADSARRAVQSLRSSAPRTQPSNNDDAALWNKGIGFLVGAVCAGLVLHLFS